MLLRSACIALLALVATSTSAPAMDPCANPADCCINTDMCVITDLETLSAITVDDLAPTRYRLASYVHGGNGVVGVSPLNYPDELCTLSHGRVDMTPEAALAAPDHYWVQGELNPKVFDFTTPVNQVLLFSSIDHEPYLYESAESTVWGSDDPSFVGFPRGWTQATLTTIYAKGWEAPALCGDDPQTDDNTKLYVFPSGQEFRYVAAFARYSVTIFETPAHEAWSELFDRSPIRGWQSLDDETDAMGTPENCLPTDVTAQAETSTPSGFIGEEFCLDGSNSSAFHGIATLGWDFENDGAIDSTSANACFTCDREFIADAQLFVTDIHGCTSSDSVRIECIDPVENFTLYKIRTTAGAEAPMPFGPVQLTDAFGSRSYDVKKSVEFGLPSDLNGAGLFDAETHVAEYKLTPTKGTPKFDHVWDVRVRNECSDLYVRLRKPVSALVPTSEDADAPPLPPENGSHELDNFVCYKTDVQKKLSDGTELPKFPKGIQIDVTDSFQTRRYDLKTVTKVCTPAALSGTPALLKGPDKGARVPIQETTRKHPIRHLVCYKAVRAKRYIPQDGCGPLVEESRGDKLDPEQNKHEPEVGLFIANPFAESQIDTKKELEVCIPSEMETASP